ncbi:MAG: ATP-dependent Clp protease adaptor ClpS [Acidobacteriota bacterium]
MAAKKTGAPRRDGELAVKERTRTRRPRRYKVLIYNDDYTAMEFVVELLQVLFGKSPSEATQVMLKIHVEGQGVAGIYPHEQAETKVLEVHHHAREAGYPLRAGMEEE